MSPPKKASDAASKLAKYWLQDKGAAEENGAESPSPVDSADDTARVLDAITDCKGKLTGKIEEVKVDVSLIRQDLQKLRDRVTDPHQPCGGSVTTTTSHN